MGIILIHNGETEELIALGDIQYIAGHTAFMYYHTGVSHVSFVYSWANETFEIGGKTFNSSTNFMGLYSALKAEIDLFNLNTGVTDETQTVND